MGASTTIRRTVHYLKKKIVQEQVALAIRSIVKVVCVGFKVHKLGLVPPFSSSLSFPGQIRSDQISSQFSCLLVCLFVCLFVFFPTHPLNDQPHQKVIGYRGRRTETIKMSTDLYNNNDNNEKKAEERNYVVDTEAERSDSDVEGFSALIAEGT